MRKSCLFLIIIFNILLTYSQSERKYIRDGNKNFSDSSFVKSEINYKKSLEINPDYDAAIFNLSNSLQKQKRFDESEEYLKKIIDNSNDSSIISDSYYNLGNNMLQQQKINEAIDAYKNCLRINPKDEEARYNLTKSLSLLNQNNNSDKSQDKNNDSDDKKENQDSGQTDGDNKKENEEQNDTDNKSSDSDQKKSKNDSEQSSHSSNEKQNSLSKDEIKRMLEALDREEKKVQDKMKKINASQTKKLEKDW